MNDLIRDIKFFEEVIIAFTEGATDEKRMMIQKIENRITKLQDELEAFEALEFTDLDPEDELEAFKALELADLDPAVEAWS